MGAFTTDGARVWPLPPNWDNGVSETLTWSTDFLQASATAVSKHRQLLIAPRRSFGFEVLEDGQGRRVADMLLAGYGGDWLLPIWPDVQFLSGLVAGDEFIVCETAGFDFAAGAKALLWLSVNYWAVVDVDEVADTGLALAAPLADDWRDVVRLYPLRRARVHDGAEETLHSDDASTRSLSFDIADACDWPALASDAIATYLGHPVLDVRPTETNDATASYSRLAQTVDYGTADPLVYDLPGVALRAQKSQWALGDRAAHTWFRSLLYTLCGRCSPIWVPSWASDLKPVAIIPASGTVMTIEWAAYTLFGLGQVNRQDLRIELVDGTVLYRRVVDATEYASTEALTLSSALSVSSIQPGAIRAVSFMALSTLASDSVEIDHATDADGLATATTGWQAVVADV
jgi:hypothetical protein